MTGWDFGSSTESESSGVCIDICRRAGHNIYIHGANGRRIECSGHDVQVIILRSKISSSTLRPGQVEHFQPELPKKILASAAPIEEPQSLHTFCLLRTMSHTPVSESPPRTVSRNSRSMLFTAQGSTLPHPPRKRPLKAYCVATSCLWCTCPFHTQRVCRFVTPP